ncbi:MAG: hypothetical protein OCD02_21255 [Spirochaetaceae bacterium]
MKKIVYVIISLMALVVLINIGTIEDNKTLKIEDANQVLEINPFY